MKTVSRNSHHIPDELKDVRQSERSTVRPSSKLTDEIVRNCPAPATGSLTIWDAGDKHIVGFGLRVFAPTTRNPTGARSFFLNYRIDGRERRFTIGEYGVWSVEAARRKATNLRKLVAEGGDPTLVKREKREAATVGDLVNRYLEEHLPRLAAREHSNQRRMLERISQYLKKTTKVADVHYGDIQAMHRHITDSGHPARANRILAVCSKMFSLALRPRAGENEPWRDAVKGNPCKGIDRNPEEAKERFLSTAELAALSDALAAHDGRSKTCADCVRLILFTGCRPGEAMRAHWEHFDSEPGFWIKPSSHTKQRKTHKVPLAPAALQLISELRAARSKTAKKNAPLSQWVFPGEIPGQPIKQLWAVWHAVRDFSSVAIWSASKDEAVAGIVANLQTALDREPTVAECKVEAARRSVELPIALQDARLYDLRHTFASVGAAGGLSLQIIGKLLGHTVSRTTERYAHLSDDPLRAAVDKIGAVIAGAGNHGAEVLNLKDRRS